MVEIEIGDIVIVEEPVPADIIRDGTISVVKRLTGKVKADFRFYGEGSGGTAHFGLLMEYHPELEAHADAIRLYMKQEARRMLGNGEGGIVGGGGG